MLRFRKEYINVNVNFVIEKDVRIKYDDKGKRMSINIYLPKKLWIYINICLFATYIWRIINRDCKIFLSVYN